MEREEELSIICVKVVVKRKVRDQSAERDSVYMPKSTVPRTEPCGNTTRGSVKDREVVIIFNTKGAR